MWIPPDVLAGLGELSEAAGWAPDALSEVMGDLVEAVLAAVPAATGVELTVVSAGIQIRVGSVSFDATGVRLVIRLPARAGVFQGTLAISAVDPAALLQIDRDLPGLLDVVGEQVEYGGEPTRNHLLSRLEEAAVVNRALGILLTHGYLPGAAFGELQRRAQGSGLTVIATARELVGALSD